MTTRQQKVNAIQSQINAGLHPLQHADEKARRKAALRVAKKMVEKALENVEAHRIDAPDA